MIGFGNRDRLIAQRRDIAAQDVAIQQRCGERLARGSDADSGFIAERVNQVDMSVRLSRVSVPWFRPRSRR